MDDHIKVLGDRYELVEPIGRGGMATIYRAKDRRMGRPVAVKILREMYSNDPKFVLRFQREARAVSALAHPNIVQVFDYGQSGEAYYIVMELIEGIDLRRYLRANGILDLRRAVVIAHDVALALGAAHRRGIVHRDVKPQNILVNDEGLVKLTDFGIATFYRDVNSERLTTTGMTLGTVQYYAPEQAQGEVVSPAADVYALGIVLYEMLVGHPPFDGDTPVSIAVRHIQEAPTRPSRYNPAIPPTLERVILRCLEKDARDRYRDGDALAYALETFDKPTRSPSGRMVSGPIATPLAEGGSGYRRAPSGPISAQSGRRPSEPRGNSYMDDDLRPSPENFIMPPTRPDIAAGTVPSPARLPERPDEGERPTAVAGITTAIIVASVLLLLGVGCFLAFRLLGSNGLFGGSPPTATSVPLVTIPDFTNKLYNPDAIALAQSDGLLLVPHNMQSTADQKGKVIGQTPPAGAQEAPGSKVDVNVGVGPNTVKVPDVTSQTYTQACNTIKAVKDASGNPANLTCQQTLRSSQTVLIGLVIDTLPGGGEDVAPGTAITIEVSTGPAATPTTAATATPTTGPATATPTTVGPTLTPTTAVPTPTFTPVGPTPTPTPKPPTPTP